MAICIGMSILCAAWLLVCIGYDVRDYLKKHATTAPGRTVYMPSARGDDSSSDYAITTVI